MSCSVFAIPYALAWVLGSLVVTAVQTSNEVKSMESEFFREDVKISTNDNICEDVKIISEADFMEKSLETPFMNREILLKTLEEYGVQNIVEEYGKIMGKFDTYSLSFEKMEADKPYFLTISYLSKNNPEEKLNDLSSEYALNVQEESYLNIIEKLKESNMQIEEEEVMEDNTIVLTINLEN